MDASEKLYKALVEDFGMEGATGSVRFNLRDFGIMVEQNNIVGNIIEDIVVLPFNNFIVFPTNCKEYSSSTESVIA